jgi:hypothetical protein
VGCARTFQGLHSVRLWTPTIYICICFLFMIRKKVWQQMRVFYPRDSTPQIRGFHSLCLINKSNLIGLYGSCGCAITAKNLIQRRLFLFSICVVVILLTKQYSYHAEGLLLTQILTYKKWLLVLDVHHTIVSAFVLFKCPYKVL